MVKAQQRVEPGNAAGLHRLGVQQRIAQRQAGVDGVTRRAAVAPRECQRRRHDSRQAGKVSAGGGAFAATQAGQIGQCVKADTCAGRCGQLPQA